MWRSGLSYCYNECRTEPVCGWWRPGGRRGCRIWKEDTSCTNRVGDHFLCLHFRDCALTIAPSYELALKDSQSYDEWLNIKQVQSENGHSVAALFAAVRESNYILTDHGNGIAKWRRKMRQCANAWPGRYRMQQDTHSVLPGTVLNG